MLIKGKTYQEFFEEHPGIEKRALERFDSLLTETKAAIEALGYKLNEDVRVDAALMWQSILDYFVDTYKLKTFEGIERTNNQKVYSYSLFWFLRRKPIQILKNVEDAEFINERVGAHIFVAKLLKRISFPVTAEVKNEDAAMEAMKPFMNNVLYNFKYRIYTQQSLELMVDALLLLREVS
ncbi:MAG: hypothetical protein FWD58_02185 [Firmicutes bacterium]|nr:hypothetical protein [Bacillota bacterium]